MKFTDLFIHKPVLAIVVSLLILVLGLRAVSDLPIRQFPATENAVVTVSTAYFGADAQTVAGFITQPLEAAIAQAQGIDYLSSSSTSGFSSITATLRLNYDANKALAQIQAQVSSVRNQLPPEAQQPVLSVAVGETTAAMYMGFYSQSLPPNNITDYLMRVVKPKLDSIEGVQNAEILGGRQFALRAWLDPARMAAHGVGGADVAAALAANNYLAAIGASKGPGFTQALTASTDLHSVEEFRQLVVRQKDGAIVRLGDIATVTLGAENYDSAVAFDGQQSVFLGIKAAPDANILDVTRRVREAFPELQAQLPTGLTAQLVYDATDFVNASIREVVKTLLEALAIVTLVIFLFLGSLRAVLVPVIAMPLSLIGAFFVMLAFGYSINLITLLALVLAIGLVVDDAIIVVENVDRHMKEGQRPLQAAIFAARELGGPILAMTVVLVAVYVPIGFQGGLTGALFTEFAFTLAGAVTVSAVVALTLSPVMCARFFRAEQESGRFVQFIDRQFERLHSAYERRLHSSLATWSVSVVMGLLLLAGTVFLFTQSSTQLAPEEDQGIVAGMSTAAPNASPQEVAELLAPIHEAARSVPESRQTFQFTGFAGPNSIFTGVTLGDWSERSRNAHEVQEELQAKWNGIAPLQSAAFQFPALPGASGLPVEVVMSTTEPFENLYAVAQEVLGEARRSGRFFFIDSNLKLDRAQSRVEVDRDLIATLGLTQRDVGLSLGAALGGGYVNYFSIAGRSYKVIPQVLQVDRLNPDQVLDYQLRTPAGAMLPAATLASVAQEVVPQNLARFQQLNSVTFQGVPMVAQGEAIGWLADTIRKLAPAGYTVDYSGQARQFMQESGGFAMTLLFAVIIVFLALAAQFNSLRDPVVILVSVPMALFGALVFINVLPGLVGMKLLGFGWMTSLNIYTQVGLVTLMGLISKHGILIVEFANQMQRAGMTKREAIEHAAAVRLRPILMTTAAMVLGVLPLVLAKGAGAAGRYNMGLVIVTGLTIGTLFTLFVVPAFYMLLASEHRNEDLPAAAGDAAPA